MAGMTIEQATAQALRRQQLTELLKTTLIERLMLQFTPDEIAEDSPLFGAGLGLDSVDALEIVVAIEKTFKITIADTDIQALRSINSIVDFIEMKQAEALRQAQEAA